MDHGGGRLGDPRLEKSGPPRCALEDPVLLLCSVFRRTFRDGTRATLERVKRAIVKRGNDEVSVRFHSDPSRPVSES